MRCVSLYLKNELLTLLFRTFGMEIANISEINVRNRLQHDLKNVTLVYAASNKLQARWFFLATEYWFDWRTVNVATEQNVIHNIRKDIGDIGSRREKAVDGFDRHSALLPQRGARFKEQRLH